MAEHGRCGTDNDWSRLDFVKICKRKRFGAIYCLVQFVACKLDESTL